MLCLSILLKTAEFGGKFLIKFYCTSKYIKYLQAHGYVSKEPISAILHKPKILPLDMILLLVLTKT